MFKSIKIILCVMLMTFYSLPTSTVQAEEYTQIAGISARAYAVMEATTHKVIYADNEAEKLPMASTTKIMTTLLALQEDDKDELFTVNPEALKVEGTSMGLREGDKVSLESLCYGMLLSSGNDAANATAFRISGSIDAFADKMNDMAKILGMQNTNFANPSGLPNESHYSTAYDMALLGSEALMNSDFTDISSSQKQKVQFGNPVTDVYLSNHNKMLEYYSGCVGLKTGFTEAAGRCLVTGAVRDGVALVCVTLNDPNDWLDHTTLLDLAFDNVDVSEGKFLPEGSQINIVGSPTQTADIVEVPKKLVSVQGEIDFDNLETEVLLEPFYYAPMQKGDAVGRVIAYQDGEIVCENDILILEDVQSQEKPKVKMEDGFFKWLMSLFSS